jgi:hypothetical protein
MDIEHAIVLRTFSDVTGADLAATELRRAGIECELDADDCAGMLPSLHFVKLRVDPKDAEEATRVLEAPPGAGQQP